MYIHIALLPLFQKPKETQIITTIPSPLSGPYRSEGRTLADRLAAKP